jgi:hypothetical protein
MKKKTTDLLAGTLLACAATVTAVNASDWVAVYGRIDKVILEPRPDAPTTIQVWGVFSLARPNDRNDYLPPARGYLYFEVADRKEVALKEWADLRQVAGTGQIVSFGSRFDLHARIRKAGERPEHPDPYVVGNGLTRVRGNTEYSPVRALVEYRD